MEKIKKILDKCKHKHDIVIAITTTKQIVKVTREKEGEKSMKSLRILNRQVGLFAAAGALLLAVVVPTIAAAAQLTERSIALSSSSKAATGVEYTIKFKTATAAAGAVIDFCTVTPVIDEPCATPTGFTAASAAGTGVASLDANTIKVTQAITANAETTITATGIRNPDATGPFYARITTYDSTDLAGGAGAYVDAENLGDYIDDGGASIIISDTIGVSGAVLESLTFCVAGNDNIGDDCLPIDTQAGLKAPTLKLGQQVGDVFALIPGTASEGNIYTQLSTNSASGAVVSLKSSTVGCGGLVRSGASNCDIAPALDSDVTDTDEDAKFGIKAGVATGDEGDFEPYDATPLTPGDAYYSTSAFKMRWLVGDTAGVTSTFGDPFLYTKNAPATNKKMTLTFGASVTNATPAGLYSADLSLIATGKF